MKRLLIDVGPHTFDVNVADDADLDGTFDAHCNDTGERIRINGWLIENSEEID